MVEFYWKVFLFKFGYIPEEHLSWLHVSFSGKITLTLKLPTFSKMIQCGLKIASENIISIPSACQVNTKEKQAVGEQN